MTSARQRVLVVRGLRGFADGFVSVSLGTYLLGLGFSPARVGLIIAGTLVGSALLTILVGLRGERFGFRARLIGASGLMLLTAIGFLSTEAFAPLLLVAIVGTMNPTAGDVSVFLPTEQAFLAGIVSDDGRVALYARYGLVGNVAGAIGALGTAIIDGKAVFVIYALVALATAAVYAGLPRDEPVARIAGSRPLEHSRKVVFTLAGLFSLDAAGGGFVVTSLLVFWLKLRFGYSTEITGAVFFVLTLLAAVSQLAAPMLARRIGLVRTMVFTHIPANGFLILAALVPLRLAGGGLPDGALIALPTRRRGAPVAGDERRSPRGTGGGREHHQRAALARRRHHPGVGRLPPHHEVPGRPAGHRGTRQGDLRPFVSLAFSQAGNLITPPRGVTVANAMPTAGWGHQGRT